LRGPRENRPAGVLAVAAVLVLVLLAPAGAEADRKRRGNAEKKKQQQDYALLYGTVFNDRGFSVRGAKVVVRQKEGQRKWEATSNSQGEFAVHLPPGPSVYIVEASVPSFTSDSKEVSFTGDERQDVALRIWPKDSGQ
jgi:hypothetical protein